MVHSEFGRKDKSDIFFSFKQGNDYYAISTYKRPYVDKFLKHAFENFEVVFYTSGIQQYANMVFDYLDPENKAAGRIYRDGCINRDGVYYKVMDRLRRNPSTVIFLDNNPLTC